MTNYQPPMAARPHLVPCPALRPFRIQSCISSPVLVFKITPGALVLLSFLTIIYVTDLSF